MEGTLLRAGAVAALPPFQHPIAIARTVLNEGGHEMYAGEGAERFALGRGFARSADDALITDLARERWEQVRSGGGTEGWAGDTVGAVARDRHGTGRGRYEHRRADQQSASPDASATRPSSAPAPTPTTKRGPAPTRGTARP